MLKNRPTIHHREQGKLAAVISPFALALCVALVPAQALAKDKADGAIVTPTAVHTLETTGDFIEYADIFSVDIHDLFFSLRVYEGTQSCILCHESEAVEALDMGHFKWAGKVENIVGMEGKELGKRDLLNNFCVAVPSNEGRCTQCHAGLGYADASFDFNNPENVDCLVCHDQSGTYQKAPTTAGLPPATVDLNMVARSISIGAKPTRKACIGCHAKAGGGDNVKHGDLSTDLIETTREYDVHMGVDGANLVCADCHGANHDPKTGEVDHGIAGISLHSVHEGEMKQCADCHGSLDAIHAGSTAADVFQLEAHGRLACQVCHIPAIARAISTKVEWYWSDAGKTVDPVPVDPETGRPTFDKKKGTFVWKNNVRPTLRWFNGKWNRKVIGLADTYSEVPIDLGSPVGDFNDPASRIYPFKLMVGNQPVDPVNQTVMVPHLFGLKGGANPYWGKWDWNASLMDGSAYTGQPYSGTYKFEDTFMLLSVNHEVAPAEHALGMGGIGEGCMDCHDAGQIDWEALGWTDNPLDGGTRPGETSSQTDLD